MTQIVSPALGLRALREAGYRNSASAVAELVDNSIEANADLIDIIAISQEEYVSQRVSNRIRKLVVVDNGLGMDEDVLQNCLSLGWGTRLDRYEGLGRFGFGLKGASISQARRVEVYSWQKPGEIFKAYLDLDEVEEESLNELPMIQKAELPEVVVSYLAGVHDLGSSGTVVVWEKLDKIDLARSGTLLRRMNKDLCRIYRHFLDDDDKYGSKRRVFLHSTDHAGDQLSVPIALRANDPLYLLKPNNLPGYEESSTNELIEDYDLFFESHLGSSRVHMRVSVAKPEIQKLGGNSVPGRHYGQNTGISVVRAGREIQIGNFGFIDSSEPRHRWWGMEIRFDPALDTVFGITNNKQEARALRSFDSGEAEAMTDNIEDEDPEDQEVIRFRLELNQKIKAHISECMKIIKSRRDGELSGKNVKKMVALVNEEIASNPVATISSHEAQSVDDNTKLKNRVELLLADDQTLTEEEAKRVASETLNYRLDVQTGSWPGDLFLDTKTVGNAAVVIVNREHPFYDKFWHHLEGQSDQKGFESLEVTLMAFCRAEDELTHIPREHLEQLRNRWGSVIRQLIRHAGS